jgi:hypothetical protein
MLQELTSGMELTTVVIVPIAETFLMYHGGWPMSALNCATRGSSYGFVEL